MRSAFENQEEYFDSYSSEATSPNMDFETFNNSPRGQNFDNIQNTRSFDRDLDSLNVTSFSDTGNFDSRNCGCNDNPYDLLNQANTNAPEFMDDSRPFNSPNNLNGQNSYCRGDLNCVYQRGYNCGFKEGRNVGFREGRAVGVREGIEIGFSRGYNCGSRDGYNNGFRDGRRVGSQAAYNCGYRRGANAGYRLGFNNGQARGYSNGFNDGTTTGFKSGYSKGNANGFNNGFNSGLQTGCVRGFRGGYRRGFNEGYAAGRQSKAPCNGNNGFVPVNTNTFTSIDDLGPISSANINYSSFDD